MDRQMAAMDLEKGIEEAVAAPDAKIQAMARGEEKGLLIPDLGVQAVTDGGVVAGNTSPGKEWLPCWLAVTASVIFLINNIHAAPKYQLTPLELMLIFTMFTCSILLVFHSMKKTM